MNHPRSALQREIRQQRPFRSPCQEAAIAVLRTADVLRQRFSALVEPRGITAQQYNVLRILRGAHPDPLPTLEIGERLIERTPGVTRLLDRLDAKGLIRRERFAGDRRQVHCWITPLGLELLADLDAEMNRLDDGIGEALAPEEIEALLSMLERVRARPPA